MRTFKGPHANVGTSYLCRRPPENGRSGEAVEESVQQPETVRFGPDQGGVDVQTVAHGVVAPWGETGVNRHIEALKSAHINSATRKDGF